LAQLLAHDSPTRITQRGVEVVRCLLDQALAAAPPPRPGGPRLRIDRRLFSQVRLDPACLVAPGHFRPTPVLCRRAIGLDAVDRCVRGRQGSVSTAVADVLAAAESRLADPQSGGSVAWWARWWSGLPAGARVVVQAEAVTWATQLWTGIAWGDLPGPAVVVTRDERWVVPSHRWCRLDGRIEVRIQTPRSCSYLVVGSGAAPADWRYDLGLPALVSALARGAAGSCATVVGWWPESGQIRVLPVDDTVLLDVGRAVVAVGAAWCAAN